MPSCPCLICADPGHALDSTDRDTVRKVEAYGWSVMMILEDENCPGWAFTIGLRHTLGVPDLVMCGLDLDLMHECLNGLADEIAAGNVASPDQRRDDVLEDHDVVIKPVDPSWHHLLLGSASSFYQHTPMQFMQVVWPTNDDRFPWDDNPSAWYTELQPSLWIPQDRHPAGPWASLD